MRTKSGKNISQSQKKVDKNMPEYTVDFEFAGHITVKAKNGNQAIDIVDGMSIDELKDHIQNFNVGKNYVILE